GEVVRAAAPPVCFLVVCLVPALLVLGIRRAVPEPEEWRAAKAEARDRQPGVRELFQGEVRQITIWVVAVCGVSLTAHWAFMFWHQQHLRNLPEVLSLSAEQKNNLANTALYLVMASSSLGNFIAGTGQRILRYCMVILF